jgi:glucokinase
MPARRTIGVDLGGTKILAGAVDPSLGVHHRVQRTVTGLQQRALLDMAVEVVAETRQSAGAEVAAVGFGLPALIDRRTGKVAVGVHTPLTDIAFADVMAERLGLPVFVDNDGNNSALAEHRAGAAKGTSDAIVLTLGTGIGGGMILDGRIYRGSRGGAGELGHMEIDFDGPLCRDNCPGRGCAELFASGPALVREATRMAGERPDSGLARVVAEGRELSGPLVTELAHDGDESAVEVVELIGARLGVVITSLVNIFNPEIVVIGGGVVAAGELLLAPARTVVAERTLPFFGQDLRIVPARFGVEAGMIGAAALAYDGLAGLV